MFGASYSGQNYLGQKYRGWININSATASTYIVQNSDVNKIIRAIIIGTNGAGSGIAASNTVGPVTDARTLRGTPGGQYAGGFMFGGGYNNITSAKPTNVTAPIISGSTVAPALITSTPGTWTG